MRRMVVAVTAAVAVAAVSALGVMYQRVRAFDARNKCNVLAGLSAEDIARQKSKKAVESVAAKPQPKATNAGERAVLKVDQEDIARQRIKEAVESVVENPQPTATNAEERAVLKVDRVDYDGDTELRVVFKERPDMEVVRNYVRVSPLIGGAVGFRYEARYNGRLSKYEPTLRVSGDYAYRTNVTLRILKGFPLYGKGRNPTAEGALEQDFEYSFRRKDPPPSVKFADDGRYLPPGGRKSVRIESVSVTNVATSICRVEPRNIVQLLAREESVYRRGSWYQTTADEEDTAELAGVCETGVVRCANRPCERETNPLAVGVNDGGPTRGVFLVTVRNGDRPRDEDEWRNPKYNPNLYRLVCLSDLGLSVRKVKGSGEGDGVGVWVTSLTSGKPVAAAHVEVYSTANILVAEGDSDANGWCVPARRAKGEPFAVVVRTKDDMTFLALRDSMRVDETYADGARPDFLDAADVDAFVWTERGIYRHDERIFVHAVVRDGVLKAPAPMPLVLSLVSPKGRTLATKTVMTDTDGALSHDGFAVPAEQPSGKWKVVVRLPGKDGKVLAEREVKVEEFAPPQIRVAVAAAETQHPTNFAFRITAEHLFGGPARSLACEGAVVFEDVPFAPPQWKGYSFGNDDRGLKPCFRRLSQRTLDDAGACDYEAPLWADSGRPKAAVRATGQGVVFEDGGRPATARKTVVCHYYPFYVGSDLPHWMKCPATGSPKIALVCVDPQGRPVGKGLKLIGKIDRIDSVYAYRKNANGLNAWDCERVRTTVLEQIEIPVGPDGRAECTLPIKECGDYVFTAEDPATGASFGRTFYLSDWGDDAVRAPLSDPTEVTIQTDKSFYRVGERPRLIVKAPFAGHALMSVLREGEVYSEVLNLTNATSVIDLRPVERAWAPNVDVAISVVQSVAANAKHLASRAHGMATVRVRPAENEIAVKADATVRISEKGGACVTVDVEAPGATAAAVTLVDEGINLLTDEETPNPVGWLARARTGDRPLFDLYGRILPVVDDALRKGGVKTGGGFGAEMLGRVSPVPTRRFKPLALWQAKVAIKDGKGRAVFDLPEFVGEVRVTAVAYSAVATGAASVRKKVTPKIVMQPDAPRFVAPGDAFDVTLPLHNRSGAAGEVTAKVNERTFRFTLAKDASTNLTVRMVAPSVLGEFGIVYKAEGFGERHEQTIALPVRPAVAWVETAGVKKVPAGHVPPPCLAPTPFERCSERMFDSPLGEYEAALRWLAEYRYGCLEQTCSRVFPLIAAGGILNAVVASAPDAVAVGVRRVESMVRENDFVMWPDCGYAPWDREVSLYAAHFLVAAEKSGAKVDAVAKAQVMKFLKKWAFDRDANVSAYAALALAIAGEPEVDRQFRLYDGRAKLSALSRARLALAFAATADLTRARTLLADAYEPQSVKEAAFVAMARTAVDPQDAKILPLLAWLNAKRDRAKYSWGTTEENAHALLAMGAYYQANPPKRGDKFVAWRRLTLPGMDEVKDEANGIFLERRFLTPDGKPADLANLRCGQLLIAELTITSAVSRVVNDLVVEDLFAGAFDPVHRELDPSVAIGVPSVPRVDDWVMRKDARDDRMLIFSKKFELEPGHAASIFYPVRVVSAGEFVLPGASVEGMYDPLLHARRAPGRIVVRP